MEHIFTPRCDHKIESWLQNTKNLTHPATNTAFIKAAKSTYRGSTDPIVNLPLFDIFDRATFKQKLIVKFKGTCSSGHFIDYCTRTGFCQDKHPLIYLTLEGVSRLSQLPRSNRWTRRKVFLQSAFFEGSSKLDNLVGTTRRLWNAHCGAVVKSDFDNLHAIYGDFHNDRSPGVAADKFTVHSKYCKYHKTDAHDSSESRFLNNWSCSKCWERGHSACACPVSSRQTSPAGSALLAEASTGAEIHAQI